MKFTTLAIVAAGALAVNAAPTRIERNLIGNQLEVIGLASQNSAVNNGNTGESYSHTSGSGNLAQQVVTDAQSIDIVKNLEPVDKPLILVEKRNLIGNQVGVIDIASQNTGVNNGNTGESNSHTSGSGNLAQQVVTDAQSIDAIKNVDVLEKPLVLVKKRNLIQDLGVINLASQNQGNNNGNSGTVTNHGNNNGNTQQLNSVDNSEIDVLKNSKILVDPIVNV